jgi:class 3 adenylate cyclase
LFTYPAVKWKPPRLLPVLISGAIIGLVCLLEVLSNLFPDSGFFRRLEWMSYDWRVRAAAHWNPPVTDKLGFVFIDDDAIAIFSEAKLGTNFQFGLYWPRHIYGRVIRELKAQGATAVGLDVLFGERRWDHGPIQTSNGLIPSDVFFQQQLKQAGNAVLGATKDVVPDVLFRSSAYAIGDISVDRDSDGVLRRVKAVQDYRIWDREIKLEAQLNDWDLARAQVRSNEVIVPRKNRARAPAVIAINDDLYYDPSELSTNKSSSGFVRLRKAFEDTRGWHMGIVLAARELNLDLAKAIIEPDKNRIILSGSNGLRRVLPVDHKGRFLIDWTLRQKDERLTTEAFESLVSKDILRATGTNIQPRFRDKLVIVGSTATGNELSDLGATPLEKDTFLTSNHWNVMNSVLTGRFIRESSVPVSFLLIVSLGFVAAFLTWKLRAVVASASILILGGFYVLSCLFLFMRYRYWMPLVMPIGSLLLTHFVLISYQAFFEQSERRRIRNVFSKIVSPNVVNELLKAERLSLVGARREVSVLFADVRGFTEMTDLSHAKAEEHVRQHKLARKEAEAYLDAQSQEVLQTVNRYLGLIADIVKKHEGTLDKYIGDCVMAFWGAPTPNEQHALACVRAAIESQRAIYTLNQDRAVENKQREQENLKRVERGETALPMLNLLSLGTGINTGVVTVGLMGSDAHIVNYTVFGREVNLAARLETVSGRGRIIIGEATHQAILRDDAALAATCIQLPPVTVKGIRTAVNIFEVPWKGDIAPTAESAVTSTRDGTARVKA